METIRNDDQAAVSQDCEGADAQFADGIGESLVTAAYQRLRDEILRGAYPPGYKLRSDELRKKFNVGRSPIREALNRLLAEGFVTAEAHRGFRVSPISIEELQELVKARCWIDGMAMREGIAAHAPEWEERLIVALHRLSRSGPRVSEDRLAVLEWEERHRDYHRALVEGCGSRWMVKTSMELFDVAERYRLYATSEIPERDEHAEHREIVNSCISRNGDEAFRLLSEHYGRTSDIIIRSLKDRP